MAASTPWTVRYAMAQLDAGRPVPPWLHMAVQYLRNGEGCAACNARRPAA